MRIGDVDLREKVIVVAEIGNNHEGSFDLARRLVQQAAECGVDGVKFQTFQTKYFVSRGDKARYERLSSFELSYPEFEQLQQLARALGLLFLSTPLDLGSAKFLEHLVDSYKIASGDNDFFPLMACVCETGKPIIVSSGVSDLGQIARSKRFIEEQWRRRGIEQDVAVLHCVSSYPAAAEELNLAAIPLLARELGCTIGYSDHTLGIAACLAATALGAQIIEKHFTLDKHYSSFRDHQLSADPAEMRQLVEQVRSVRLMLGKAEKAVQPSETVVAHLIRRSIVAAADLLPGQRVERRDLMWIRPAVGLPPGEEGRIVGRRLRRSVAFGEPILLSDLE